ncbi:ferrous iron transport protein B [Candidatus Poribacteria bacterium]|nr:ferrous iron transport protein B [Candidatus Poribacteria bacterium]
MRKSVTSQPTVVLIGNPNTGKTTLFNALTGLSQRTGNFPGVTVEKKVGVLDLGHLRLDLIDLPGTYSLAANSPDEIVATDVLLGQQEGTAPPDLVIVVADASNLERNLYLTTQVLECSLPVILVLNMYDLAVADGLEINTDLLSHELGCQVVPVIANKGEGINELQETIEQCLEKDPSVFHLQLGAPVEDGLHQLLNFFNDFSDQLIAPIHRVEVLRLLIDEGGIVEQRLLEIFGEPLDSHLNQIRQKISEEGTDLLLVEPETRYQKIGEIIKICINRKQENLDLTVSDRVDRFLTHPIGGTMAFFVLMAVVFQAIYKWAAPLMDLIDGSFGWLGNLVSLLIPEGAIQSLIVDGVIAGVGGVAIFLPQIVILFGFIAVLEDCGYMARAAFLMDRLMSWVGLSGKSFVPMLSSFACAIPGVMATRVIENRRDRFTTILVAPLMSCSARLPVYTIMIAAFIPAKPVLGFFGLQGITLLAMYMIGVVVAIPVAWLFKKTILKGETPPFVMEMPPYKIPDLKTIILRMLDRGKRFLVDAGTIIFATTVLIWGLLYYPRPQSISDQYDQKAAEIQSQTLSQDKLEEQLNTNSKAEAGAFLRQSVLGRLGNFIEPVVKPLGWDWKIGIAVIASFPAREVVVAILGIIYNLGSEESEESENLRQKMRNATWDDDPNQKVFTPIVALSVMVFFALCAQCAATLAVIKRETGSWKWPVFTFSYMTILAYCAALITYQISNLLI